MYRPKDVELKTQIVLSEGSKKFLLDTCLAVLDNKVLYLEFKSKKIDYESPYDLKVEVHNQKITATSEVTMVVTDSSFRATNLTMISQKINLNNKLFKKNDTVSGSLQIGFSAYHSWIDVYTDTIKMNGIFKAYIQ